MKQVDIKKKKKLPKRKNTIDLGIDFTSISKLKGNRIILEHTFQLTKNEFING
jgi:hypothetical protein